MRHLPVLILMTVATLLSVTTFTGCGGTVGDDARLVAADSLLSVDADSALALVESLSRDSLPREGDRAYRDLLVTQARYKCYITATSDSDINRALAYYRAHDDEREKLTRAYIYKGAVMEELGHPDSTMLYYKHAEATAAPDDYFNLGYANLRIAELYQSLYINDSAVVARMKKAYSCFVTSGDTTRYLIISIGTQGVYDNILGKDSARFYLKKAIDIAKKVKSPIVYQYQSKLAGSYFYDGDYKLAKDIAMNVIREGRDACNEDQYYYYAARSFIHLNNLDSTFWVMSFIPDPVSAEDSMNYFQTMAELSQACHKYKDYNYYEEKARKIDTRLLENARDSKLAQVELQWNIDLQEKKLKVKTHRHLLIVISFTLVVLALLCLISIRIIKKMSEKYQSELDINRKNLESMINDLEENREHLLLEQEKLKIQLNEKNTQPQEEMESIQGLELEHEIISKKVSSIARYRFAALNELYQNIRVKTDLGKDYSREISLVRLIKKLYESKDILHTPPKETFWENLKLSVDGEFQGIASFVEQNYPRVTKKDFHLFCLLCAKFPNRIIKFCMNYTNDVTVSKSKKKLMKERIGMDMKLEEFIDLYLQGK